MPRIRHPRTSRARLGPNLRLAEELRFASSALACREPRERAPELGLETQELLRARFRSKFTLEIAARVRDAQIGSVRCGERAAVRSAKRATRLLGARRNQSIEPEVGELQREELVVREQSVRSAPTAVSAGPASVWQRMALCAAGTALDARARELARQPFTQVPQPFGQGDVLGVQLGCARGVLVARAQLGEIIGALRTVAQTVQQAAKRNEVGHFGSAAEMAGGGAGRTGLAALDAGFSGPAIVVAVAQEECGIRAARGEIHRVTDGRGNLVAQVTHVSGRHVAQLIAALHESVRDACAWSGIRIRPGFEQIRATAAAGENERDEEEEKRRSLHRDAVAPRRAARKPTGRPIRTRSGQTPD